MQVKVKLFASLRDGRFKEEMTDVQDNSKVIDIIEKYNIPAETVAVSFVNGRSTENDYPLQNGDTVSLFPPVGGC